MFLIFSMVLTAVSLCTALWVVMRPVMHCHKETASQMPRSWATALWPWVLALAPVCEPFLSWRIRAQLVQQVQRAGLGMGWQPARFVALQLTVGLLIGGMIAFGLLAGLAVPWWWSLTWAISSGLLAACFPLYWLTSLCRHRQQQMLRELPFLLDMTTLCVEAGLNLQGALQQATQYGPDGPLRQELQHALTDMRAGVSRLDALIRLVDRTGLAAMASLVSALTQADQMGVGLGPLLRSQSELRRSERFLRAEKLALQAPVKMLFPMVICIFPCTFLIIGFPIVSTLLNVAA